MPSVKPQLPSFQTRVVGGTEAPRGVYKYIASLQQNSFLSLQHFCGASILNEQWILTAAHCAAGISASSITVKVGKFNLKVKENTEQTAKVSKVYIHEKYKGDVGGNDIALMKLDTPLQFNEYVQPIALPKPNSEPTGDVWLCGWGSTSTFRYPIMPSTLQHVMMHIIDRKTCDATMTKAMGSPSPVDETNICTGPVSSKPNSACSGDSGGPLASFKEGKWEIDGVVSWGMVPCGSPGMPSVFAKVSHFVDWIEKKI
ncbi:Trypsin-1 [Trachymyrmex septentrionalis]|uniref:chymotrypsin n=2 Tax=Trachymyrmex septentrionalis TaxID=34720 RepID=A0A195F7F1_9HYME|nr:Trypsin-1 [Trachymyrmex septentrionalis]